MRGVSLVLGLCFALACKVDSPVTVADEDLDGARLVEALRESGATVTIEGGADQPFFGVSGQMLRVIGQEVQAFEYATSAAAEADASRIAADGSSVGTTFITWVATPHFFRAGRVIALYVGDDPSVLSALRSVLGPRIAGG